MCVCLCLFLVVEYGERGKEYGLLTCCVGRGDKIHQSIGSDAKFYSNINNNEEVKCNWTLTGQQRKGEGEGN